MKTRLNSTFFVVFFIVNVFVIVVYILERLASLFAENIS